MQRDHYKEREPTIITELPADDQPGFVAEEPQLGAGSILLPCMAHSPR